MFRPCDIPPVEGQAWLKFRPVPEQALSPAFPRRPLCPGPPTIATNGRQHQLGPFRGHLALETAPPPSLYRPCRVLQQSCCA
eukprot:774135-Pyramimonas_sp.AAC.1